MYRYEQLDGTLALPFKSSGKYHFAGKVQVCSDSVLWGLRVLYKYVDMV